MKKLIFAALAAVAILASPVSAQVVTIAPENRVANIPGGFCGYAAVETLGRHHGIKSLHGLRDARRKVTPNGVSNFDMLASELALRNVKHGYTRPGTYSTGMIENAIRDKSGIVVGLKPLPGTNVGHFVIVNGWTDKEVTITDSNEPQPVVITRERFMQIWNGSTLTVGR